MVEASSGNFQQVFNRHLKELNLREFPLGDGKWRNNLDWESDLLHSKQYGDLASLFTNQGLNELTNHEVFKKISDWSTSIDDVLNETIKHPKQKLKNIYSHFKSLRFVDENITAIDSSISQFHNLHKLTLTSNKIECLDLEVLPESLQVLELCGNAVHDVDFLCTTATNLHYIGLGYNYISSISKFQTAPYFDPLICLDLSFNLMDDLKGSVKALKHIPKLRVLLFQGNPLFLCMGYRGYVIDSLATLTCLDDTDISADERLSFKGMSELDLPFDNSMLKIVVDDFQNAPDTDGHEAEDYPKNAYTYFMQLDFLEKEEEEERGESRVSHMILTPPREAAVGCDGDTSNITIESSIGNPNQTDVSGTAKDHSSPGITTSKESKTLKELFLEASVTLKNCKRLHDYLSNSINVKLVQTTTLLNTIPKNEKRKTSCDITLAPIPSRMKGSNATVTGGVAPIPSKLKGSNAAVAGKTASKTLSKSTASKVRPLSTATAPKDQKKDKKDKKAVDVTIYEWSKTSDTIGHAHVSCDLLLNGAAIVSYFTPFRHPSSVTDAHSGHDSSAPCMQVVTETIFDCDQQLSQQNPVAHDDDGVSKITVPTVPIIQTSEYIDDNKESRNSEEVTHITQGVCVDESVPEAQVRIELTRWASTREGMEWVANNAKHDVEAST